ncbi:MAG: bifunctional adenosylcobinamide kinase/adenosylcobinamide-phosphate guanylyltransferase, partial [Spirochaetales bacterium]|nr:bifunctional adenosylcobinamide kinase/adenosylcobinamide-phosphate guanylyltransferase [Spirochaetales bacterium]
MTRLLITGGIKSGKSSYALERADLLEGKKNFLATAIPFDKEMEDRIVRHKGERGSDYITTEEPMDIHLHTKDNLILDCVTVWMNNLFHTDREDEWEKILKSFILANTDNIIIVSNEVGLGNIPMDPVARKYNEYLAAANKMIAKSMDEVVLMVSGLPMWV